MNAPDKIYLQWHDDPNAEITWCEDRVAQDGDVDVEYVRADIAEAAEKRIQELENALRSLVNTLPQSELEIMRECIGNTNVSVISHWITNAKFILDKEVLHE